MKYNINKQKCDYLKYHNFEEIRKQELESTLSEEETRERNIYSSKMFEKKKN